MTCTKVALPGGGVVIACRRGPARKKPCVACGHDAQAICDRCDRPVCPSCSVAPVSSQDFCPGCFLPAWKEWLRVRTVFFLAHPDIQRDERRRAFRAWVRENATRFAELVPMSAAGIAAKVAP